MPENSEITGVSLGDLGERGIIEDILRPRYERSAWKFGDDCASLRLSPGASSWLVATTDPCPLPAASLLGFADYYYWGWLLGTINLSDIAAAGATPLGFLSSFIFPNSFLVPDFTRLLDGLDDCCKSVETEVIGGNIKEGPSIDLSGTAIGSCGRRPMSRQGAAPGDSVVIVGDLGLFWSGYLAVNRDLAILKTDRTELLRNVLTPSPKVLAGQRLLDSGVVKSCIDNSDGLYPSLIGLTHKANLGVHLDLDSVDLPAVVNAVGAELDLDPVRLLLGWGDWQLILVTSNNMITEIRALTSDLDLSAQEVGRITETGCVRAVRKGHEGELLQLDSQRFSPDSWFSSGITTYIEKMSRSHLIIEH